MNILLDLLGSTLIGSVIFMLVINLNIFTHSALYTSDSELKLQQNAKTLAEILNYDLRKVGYKCDSTYVPMIIADSNRVKFYSDLDKNGSIDQLEFCLSNSSAVAQTQNPRDIIIYRIFNGDTLKGPSLGLTKLKFSYMNQFKQNTFALDSIKYIQAQIYVESDYEVENIFGVMEYQKTYWEMTINPRNL